MKRYSLSDFRLYFTLLVALFVWVQLLWQHFNGGVPKHYILHSADMPAISNWWGGLILPLLSWFLIGRVQQRQSGQIMPANIYAFFGAFLYGVVMAASFVNGLDKITSVMAPALLVLALFLPIYRAEYILGFVLGMSHTFGAVLPTAFSIIVASLAVVIYNYIRPLPIWAWRKLKAPGRD